MWVNRKKYNALVAAAASQLAAMNAVKQHAYLIGLERKERVNVFTFARGDQVVQIETMGLISDDFGQWRKDLGV